MGEEKKRLSYFDIASSAAESVKTFDGKTYSLKGALAVEKQTGEIKRVAEIYYRVRSVRDEKHNIIAKRKQEDGELVAIPKTKKKN